MNDPHVEALTYRLVPTSGVTFDSPPLTWEHDGFRIEVSGDTLTARPIGHFANEEDARTAVEPQLQAWRISDGLANRSQQFHLDFERSRVIDRNPPPGTEVYPQAAVIRTVALDALLVKTRNEYPAPPSNDFSVSPDVETMWSRWQGYRDGREPLASMAFVCLTVLEASSGIRKGKLDQAARQYGIHRDVLRKLSYLTSEVGDELTARKAGIQEQRPHTDAERQWIEEVVLALIRRAAEYGANPSVQFQQLTMSNFPPL